MVKVLKILGRSIYLLVELLLAVIIFIAFAIQTFTFQTWLGKQATSYFSSEWNTEVNIERIEIVFIDQLELKGVYVEDLHQDTLLFSKNIRVTIDDWSLNESYVTIGAVDLAYSRVNLKILEGEEDMNFQFIADYFATDEPPEESEPFRVDVKRIGIDYVNFSYNDENEPEIENGLDFNHLNVDYLKGEFTDFGSVEGDLFVNIENLEVIDRSGLHIKKLTTHFEMNEKGFYLNPFELHYGDTQLNTEYLNFEVDSMEDFNDFTNKVILRTNILSSTIHIQDIAYFVPDLWGSKDVVQLSGIVSGPINGLKIQDLDLKTLSNTSLQGDFELPNFEDMENSPFMADIKSFKTTATDLKQIQLPPYDEIQYLEIPSAVENMGTILLTAMVEGTMDDLSLKSKLITQIGSTTIDASLLKPENEDYQYEGRISTQDLHAGLLAQVPELGRISSTFLFKGSGTDEKNLRIMLDGSEIHNLVYNHYNYKKIKLKKTLLTARDFKGNVSINDALIDFDLDGYFKFAGREQGGQITLDLRKAYLAKLGIMEGHENTNFKTYLNVDIHHLDPEIMYGKLSIDTLYYYDSSRVYDFNKIYLKRSKDLQHIAFQSPILDFNLDGNFDIQHFSSNVINSLSQVMPNLFFREKIEVPEIQEHFTFSIFILDFNYINELFLPDLDIGSNTIINGRYYADKGLLTTDIRSSAVNFDGYIFEDLNFSSELADKHFDMNCDVKNIILNDSLYLPNFKTTAYVETNSMETTIKWDSTAQMKGAYIDFIGSVDTNSVFFMNFNPSYFHIKQDQWDISETGRITFDTTSIAVNEFRLTHKNQNILVNGKVSEDIDEKLNFDINDFNLNYITTLFGLDNQFEGLLNGEGYVADIYNKFIFGANNTITNLVIDDNKVGDIVFNQTYDSNEDVFKVNGNITRDLRKTFDYFGRLDFDDEDNQLDLTMSFDKINIDFMSAFVDEEDYSNIQGVLDGNISVKGLFNAPILRGDLNFLGGNVKVGMLGVNFGYGGNITVRDGMIALNNLPIIDEDGNQGHLIATVFHDNFTNWSYDVFLDLDEVKRFKVMDTKYKEGDYYYGKAYINGVAGVSGDEKDLYIDVTATTKKDTRVIMPLTGPTQVSEQDFIVFVNKDSVSQQIKDDYDLTGVHMNINLDVTKEAEFKLVFDESTGDVITAACEGPMNIIIDKYGDLKIYGSLMIDRGDYLFGMSNVVSKSFTIVPGGTIDWIGDPYNANIDISTIYQVKAPMKGLMSGLVGPEEIEKYATPELINCILILQGTLMEPTFAFDIEAPRADDQARAALQRVKKTEDELKNQFFSLLLLQKFIPTDGTTGTGLAGGGASAVSEMISNQLSNLLSQMSEEYQIGVKYATDQESHSNELEVGVSTELLNEKLIISGSLGVANTTATGESASSVIGDINVEYKLNKDGTFTVSVFNESNEFDVTKSTMGRFTQGFGVNYKESFQTVAEFALVQHFLNVFRNSDNKWEPIGEKETKKIDVPEEGKEEEVIDRIINGNY